MITLELTYFLSGPKHKQYSVVRRPVVGYKFNDMRKPDASVFIVRASNNKTLKLFASLHPLTHSDNYVYQLL